MPGERSQAFAKRLIAAVATKIEANSSKIENSVYGRITWRVKGDELEIDLEPKL